MRVKRGFVEAAVRHQEAHGVWRDGVLSGVSLAQSPEQYPPSISAKFWQSSGCATTGPRGVLHFLRVDAALARKHPRDPHYYLFVLGVDPPSQGHGLGKALLTALSARADARSLPCYLETDKRENIVVYEHSGYRVIEEFDVPNVPGFHLWTMRRPHR
jgi:GNAT superfamily N-acetyltransferase